MYYVYYSDKHNRLYITTEKKKNQIPIFSTPFLIEVMREIARLEKSFGLNKDSTDLAEIYYELKTFSTRQNNQFETDYELV